MKRLTGPLGKLTKALGINRREYDKGVESAQADLAAAGITVRVDPEQVARIVASIEAKMAESWKKR